MHRHDLVVAAHAHPKARPEHIEHIGVENIGEHDVLPAVRNDQPVVDVAGPRRRAHAAEADADIGNARGRADEVGCRVSAPVKRWLDTARADIGGGMGRGAGRHVYLKAVGAKVRCPHPILMAVKGGRRATLDAHGGSLRIAVRVHVDRGHGAGHSDAGGVGILLLPARLRGVGLAQQIEAVECLHHGDIVGRLNRFVRCSRVG